MRPTPVRTDRGLRMLRARLAGGSALPFAEAVLRQVAQPLGARPDEARTLAAARVICALLEGAVQDPMGRPEREIGGEPVGVLAKDPVLLAAFFQNVDLLYRAGAPEADRVGTWIMAAVEAAGVIDARSGGERSRQTDEKAT